MSRPSVLSRNSHFVIGLLLGLVISCYIPQGIWELVQQEECPQEAAENLLIERFGQDFEPHLNLINKPLAAKKPVSQRVTPPLLPLPQCNVFVLSSTFSPWFLSLTLSFCIAVAMIIVCSRKNQHNFRTWSTHQSESVLIEEREWESKLSPTCANTNANVKHVHVGTVTSRLCVCVCTWLIISSNLLTFLLITFRFRTSLFLISVRKHTHTHMLAYPTFAHVQRQRKQTSLFFI